MNTNKIYVTKSLLPDLNEYTNLLNRVWSNNQLTNNGSLVQQLEVDLLEYLDVPNVELVSNGTIALQLAIKAAGLKGEIITTPFTYVATTTAILWENCKPVFVDIDSKSLCIDVTKIESAITENTSAILATHVFGYPCNVDAIEEIATKHGLVVIYDAAHAFGVKYKGKSLLNYGDMSTLSFHATKIFHSAEGGAIISNDASLIERINLLKRFGHDGEDSYICEGINAKMSELHAAMGLCVLDKVDNSIRNRKLCSEHYDRLFANQPSIYRPQVVSELEYNYSYYPIVLSSEQKLLKVKDALNCKNIYPRRYFFPSLNKLPYLDNAVECPVSESVATRVLALPLSHELSCKDIDFIASTVIEAIK